MPIDEDDWKAFLQRLVDGTRTAVRNFAAQHSDAVVCSFAYDSDLSAGYVLTSFNTASAEAEFLRKTQEERVPYRKKLLAQPVWRDRAFYQVKANRLMPYCNSTGDFAFQDFADIRFPEWEEFFQSPEYPEPSGTDDDYLQSRVAAIFVRALDLLAEDGTFSSLRLASLTLLGFVFHDEEHVVVRMLRCP